MIVTLFPLVYFAWLSFVTTSIVPIEYPFRVLSVSARLCDFIVICHVSFWSPRTADYTAW